MSSVDTSETLRPSEKSIWYSFSGKKYEGNLPAFFDVSKDATLNKIASSAKDILEETKSYLKSKNDQLQPYFDRTLVSGSGNWSVLHFNNWGRKNESVMQHFPITSNLLEKLPLLTGAAISRLSPHTEILPHIGDTNAVMRCHLGLHVPAVLPECGIKVKDETRSWEPGKWLAFCDAHEHSTWNRTDEYRYVLIADILLPEFAENKSDICANVRSMLELHAASQRHPWINKLPGKVRGLIRRYYKATK